MKCNGQKLVNPATRLMVFQREDGESFLEFKLTAMGNRKKFDQLVPEPKPATARDREGNVEPLVNEPAFKAASEKRNELFRAWLVINAITPSTEWLEWETVDLEKPDTWLGWEDEMEAAGISYGERLQLMNATIELNSLTKNAVDEAMKTFFRMLRREQKQQNSPEADKPSTTSSESASDSE